MGALADSIMATSGWVRGVTSQTKARQMANAIEQGFPAGLSIATANEPFNRIPNGDFRFNSRGVAYPPDGWSMHTGTWGTHVMTDTGTVDSGLYSLKFADPSGGSSLYYIQSDFIPVSNSEYLQVEATVRATNNAMDSYIYLDFYTGAGVFISSMWAMEKTFALANTWYTSNLADLRSDVFGTNPLKAPSNARYVRVRIGLGSGLGANNIFFDRVRLFSAELYAEMKGTVADSAAFASGSIDFPSKVVDPWMMLTASALNAHTSKVTIPVNGRYQIATSVYLSTINTANVNVAAYISMTAGFANDYKYNIPVNGALGMNIHLLVNALAGDIASLTVQTSAGTLIQSGTGNVARLSIRRLP